MATSTDWELMGVPVASASQTGTAHGGTKPNEGRRLDAIQGLRALAIVFVIVYHAGLPFRGGFIGVDVFFTISGFVITRLVINTQRSQGRLSFADFYRRRVRRLLPALTLMVSVVVVASMLIESPIGTQGDTAVVGTGASVWLANAALYYVTSGYFAPNSQNAVLLHTWSLAVEEQFYIVFPALIVIGCVVAAKFRRSRHADYPRFSIGLMTTAVLLLSFLINIYLCYGKTNIPAPQGVAFFFPFSRAWEFAAGALVAIGVSTGRAIAGPLRAALSWVGLLLVVASGALIPASAIFPGYVALLPVIGTALLIAGVVTGPTAIGTALAVKPLKTIGDYSYSLYLWHWPFIAFSVTVWGPSIPLKCAAVVLSFPVAYASYVYIEQPIRQRKKMRGRARKLVATCIAVPVALSAVLFVGGSAAWGNARIHDAQAQVGPKSLNEKTCQIQDPIPDRNLKPCTYPGNPAKEKIYLLGDSNAGQYANGLVMAAKELDQTVVLATSAGCSFNLVEVYSEGVSADCLHIAKSNLAWLEKQPPAIVLVASANEFVDGKAFTIEDPATGKRSSNKTVKGQMWQAGLTTVFNGLRAAGDTVVQVRSIPHFTANGAPWTPGLCTFPTLLFHFDSCGPTETLAHGDSMHKVGLAAEQAAAEATGVRQLDLNPVICPSGSCSVRDGTFWIYREGTHLSVGMSKRLAPQLLAALRGADSTTG